MRPFRFRSGQQWRPLLAVIILIWLGLLSLQHGLNSGENVVTARFVLENSPYVEAGKVVERIVVTEEFYAQQDNTSRIWPSRNEIEPDDRIMNQLRNVPLRYSAKTSPQKLIVYLNPNAISKANGRLVVDKCPVQKCTFTSDTAKIMEADAVLIKSPSMYEPYASLRHPRQLWIIYVLESPYHSSDFSGVSKYINWTATYRRDSVIVTPYEKFVPFANFSALPEKPQRNYALNKTKMVAWFVSNCNARNGRGNYVEELRKYVDVDIYGSCGEKSCKRSSSDECFNKLKRNYKFYLSFENSNCKDYITEKLYWNAYLNDIVPIVMGARPEDYAAVAPPASYIHVDDFESPKALAEYLHRLDKDDALYNSYFRWKGTGEFINTKFWCRLCSMVHAAADAPPFWYRSVSQWWKDKAVCTKPSDNPHGRWASWRYAPKNYTSLLP